MSTTLNNTMQHLVAAEVSAALPRMLEQTPDQLEDDVWPILQEATLSQELARGTRGDQIVDWFEQTTRALARSSGDAGRELRRLLRDEQTHDSIDALAKVCALLAVLSPELRDWPIAQILALVVVFLRRRRKAADGRKVDSKTEP